MSNQLNCEIIRDLLPAYLEGLTSEVTNREIKRHLENCIACTNYYKEMNSSVNISTEENIEEVKKVFTKTKRMYIINGVFWTLCILSIFIPLIVDFCVNKYLTWSYIVLGGCIIGYSLFGIIIFNTENRMRNMIIVISLAVIPYIYLIECIINKYYIVQPVYWFKSIGLPIVLVWILMIWIDYFVWLKLRKNIYYKISIFSITTLLGSIFTDLVVFLNGYSMKEDSKIDYLVYLLVFIVFFVLAKIKDKRYK